MELNTPERVLVSGLWDKRLLYMKTSKKAEVSLAVSEASVFPATGQGALASLEWSQGFTRGATHPSLDAVLTSSSTAQWARRRSAGFAVSGTDARGHLSGHNKC